MTFSFKKLLALTVLTSWAGLAFADASKRVVILDRDSNSIEAFAATLDGSIESKLTYHKGFVAHLSEHAINKIKSKFPGVRIEEDFEVKLLGHKASGKPQGGGTIPAAQVIPWGIAAVQAPQAFAISRGLGSIVCVVDTGIQTTHPDLVGQVIDGQNFVAQKGRINPLQYSDDNGHGTHVAGTIAALDNSIGVIGVAPDAKLMAMKVLDRQGSGFTSAVAEGIRSCTAKRAHIISMSLGSSVGSTLLLEAIRDARAAGLIVVAAAGNEAGAVSYPAAYSEVLAISAVNQNMQLAAFSNSGPEVDYAAPGVAVYSTTNNSSYATFNGTSMATPHAAGVIALGLSAGSLGIVSIDLGLPAAQQGLGLIDALSTVMNH